MKIRRTALVVGLAALVSHTGCASKRTIDADTTGSVLVPGTTWYRMCDGANAIFWVKGYTESEPDEIEMVIYDHWACVTDGQPVSGESNNGPAADPDGIVEDEDQ